MSSGIVCAGNFLVDRVKMIDTYPAQDALANIRSESIGNGGCAFSTVLGLAKLGATFPLWGCGLVGNDTDGAWVRAVCEAHRIHTDALQIVDAPTSYTDVMTVESTGRRTFFHQRGANAQFGPEHVLLERTSAKHLHLGYLLLLDRMDQPDREFGTVAGRALSDARDRGLTTSIDVVSEDSSRFPDLVVPTLDHVDVAFMNEFELGRTVGRDLLIESPSFEDELASAADDLLKLCALPQLVVHTPLGGWAFARSNVTKQGSVRMHEGEVVGTVGAGDAFAAGFLLAWHEARPIEECLRSAVCSAAVSLTHASASDGLRPLDECLAFGDARGYQ